MSQEQATDPNITPRELLHLAGSYPDEILANPALPLLLMERPEMSTLIRYLRCWRQGEMGGWIGLSESEQEVWLHCAYERQFKRGSFTEAPTPLRTDQPIRTVFELPGRFITQEESFFCAIGEAINGPGGYFGRNLNAFFDCCRGGFGLKPPSTIRWKDSALSRQALEKLPYDPENFYELVVSCIVDSKNILIES